MTDILRAHCSFRRVTNIGIDLCLHVGSQSTWLKGVPRWRCALGIQNPPQKPILLSAYQSNNRDFLVSNDTTRIFREIVHYFRPLLSCLFHPCVPQAVFFYFEIDLKCSASLGFRRKHFPWELRSLLHCLISTRHGTKYKTTDSKNWGGARDNVVGWGIMLQAGRSRVRLWMRSLEYSIDINLPAVLWPWGRLSLWQKWVPGIFLWVKGGRRVRLTAALDLWADCIENVGASTYHKPVGLHDL
jgi:hypothetical protein